MHCMRFWRDPVYVGSLALMKCQCMEVGAGMLFILVLCEFIVRNWRSCHILGWMEIVQVLDNILSRVVFVQYWKFFPWYKGNHILGVHFGAHHITLGSRLVMVGHFSPPAYLLPMLLLGNGRGNVKGRKTGTLENERSLRLALLCPVAPRSPPATENLPIECSGSNIGI